jgi:Bacterial type II/III secretion system short domain/Bacterial type II and III secretion system protein
MKWLFALWLVFSLSAHAQTELRIFTLQHHFAQDLYSVVSPLVGADGTVTGMNNQLIVRATPAQLAEIEAVIATFDKPRVNRKITVQSNRSNHSTYNNTEASGNVNIGNVTIGTDGSLNNNARIDVTRQQNQHTQNSQQFIQVVDGEPAFIQVGKLVPFSQDWVLMTKRYKQTIRTTDWVEVSTGFAVRPRTIGNQVEIEITPRIAKFNGQQSIDFEELSTVIRTQLGEWVNIGQTMQQHDELSRKILGTQSGTYEDKSNLSIRVD